MTRAAIWLLAAGMLLFAGVLISQGLTAVFSTLAVAGWGLPLVALIHLPLANRKKSSPGFTERSAPAESKPHEPYCGLAGVSASKIE